MSRIKIEIDYPNGLQKKLECPLSSSQLHQLEILLEKEINRLQKTSLSDKSSSLAGVPFQKRRLRPLGHEKHEEELHITHKGPGNALPKSGKWTDRL